MARLQPGVVFETVQDSKLTIEKYIAGGGQGDVYLVDYNGEKKALKWYKRRALRNPKAFYENMKNNVAKGSPDSAFLWPQDIAKPYGGSFGYVMDLRPDEFRELTEFQVGTATFSSFKAAVEACIRIVSAFRLLHNRGYCYQDINDGNFFIDGKTGRVLICDNDNIAPNNTETFILGTPRYLAPELVEGAAKVAKWEKAKADAEKAGHDFDDPRPPMPKPCTQTDRFSLAVVLFTILCMGHPLEGRRWMAPCLTPSMELKLYGTDPLFIFDPGDGSNGPVKGTHDAICARWTCLPAYMKEAFLKAFSSEALKDPNRRLRELDWLKVLVRFQSDIVRCPSCGNEIFISDASDTACDNASCGRTYQVERTLDLGDYSITAARGTRVYRCQLGSCNADDALDPVALVVTKKENPSILGLQNKTNDTMVGYTTKGAQNRLAPGGVAPLKPGIVLEVYDGKLAIR